MKSRLGLILCGIGLVLALVVTANPMIEHKFVRILAISGVFYLIGLGLDIFYRKFIAPVMKEPEGDPAQARMGDSEMNSLVNNPSTSSESKGGRFDFKVGSDGDAPLAEAMPGSGSAAPSKLEEMADKVSGKVRTTPYGDKFEVRDDFILINDKKIPNDPKMMADAIKTKLSE